MKSIVPHPKALIEPRDFPRSFHSLESVKLRKQQEAIEIHEIVSFGLAYVLEATVLQFCTYTRGLLPRSSSLSEDELMELCLMTGWSISKGAWLHHYEVSTYRIMTILNREKICRLLL